MKTKQKEFYDKLGDALKCYGLKNTQKFLDEYNQWPDAVINEAAQKLHDLWPSLCELDEVGKQLSDKELIEDVRNTEPYITEGRWPSRCVLNINNISYKSVDERDSLSRFIRDAANARPTISKAVGGGDE